MLYRNYYNNSFIIPGTEDEKPDILQNKVEAVVRKIKFLKSLGPQMNKNKLRFVTNFDKNTNYWKVGNRCAALFVQVWHIHNSGHKN